MTQDAIMLYTALMRSQATASNCLPALLILLLGLLKCSGKSNTRANAPTRGRAGLSIGRNVNYAGNHSGMSCTMGQS